MRKDLVQIPYPGIALDPPSRLAQGQRPLPVHAVMLTSRFKPIPVPVSTARGDPASARLQDVAVPSSRCTRSWLEIDEGHECVRRVTKRPDATPRAQPKIHSFIISLRQTTLS
ncbi:hypothetical protein MRB53_041636 [Persea americana]|nr:hypothetical protein MRB53_041636 [Persea americana]